MLMKIGNTWCKAMFENPLRNNALRCSDLLRPGAVSGHFRDLYHPFAATEKKTGVVKTPVTPCRPV
jgi:hypothetical protein